MGASTFATFVREPNPTEAFRAAVDKAAYESGHCGGTGTVAEKRSFTIIDKTPRALRDAEVHASSLIDANDARIDDKWGPAGAIAVTDDPTPASTSTRQVTVRNDDPNLLLALRREQHLELVRANLARSLRTNASPARGSSASTSPCASSTRSRTNRPPSRTSSPATGTRGRRHTDLEAARAEMAALADRARHDLKRALANLTPDGNVPKVDRPTEYAIHTLVGGGFGQSRLERTTLVHDGETLTFEATIARYGTDPNANTVGWIFFGWASH